MNEDVLIVAAKIIKYVGARAYVTGYKLERSRLQKRAIRKDEQKRLKKFEAE